MNKFEISILNFTIVSKKRIEDLETKIQDLEREVYILKEYYDRIDDL
jgi:hypothetical protein